MKKLLITILFPFLYTNGNIKNIDEPKYTFIKKENGITLFYRWITMSEKLKVRELKVEFDISSSPGKIISILKNDKLATQWMKGTSEVKGLGNAKENQWHSYIQYEIPWPLSNQDCIVRYDVKHDPSNNSYFISMNGLPRFIPPKEGITRIQHLQGSWHLVPLNKNTCRVEYTVFSAQAPKFPRWITDPIVQGNLISTMETFRSTVEKTK